VKAKALTPFQQFKHLPVEQEALIVLIFYILPVAVQYPETAMQVP
jgi:hypothetical protein